MPWATHSYPAQIVGTVLQRGRTFGDEDGGGTEQDDFARTESLLCLSN
jgi:hypothetical protein